MNKSCVERNHPAAMIELGVRFHLWATALNATPDWRRIAQHFNCSRATAYRWLAAWKAANAQP